MTKFCNNCGHPITEGNLFCESCGARVISQQNIQSEQTAAPGPVQPKQQELKPSPMTQPVQQSQQQPVQSYSQPVQQSTQSVRPYPQSAQPYPQYPAPQPAKKKGWIIALIITGVLTVAALVVIILIIIPLLKPHVVNVDPTLPAFIIEQSTEAPTEELTEAPAQPSTQAPTEAPTAASTQAPTKAPKQASTQAPTKAPKQAPTQAPVKAPKKAPKAAPTEAPAPLPYVDSIGAVNDYDFAWIADAMGGSLSGSFISNDDLVGKWKGELIYDGVWELVYVTIDRDGTITVEPYQINYGDGWESEAGDEPYTFNGSFDVNRVVGAGKYGKMDLYQFVESNGVQYGLGDFHVDNGNEARVYLVRP